jgi:hypothetical protein
VIRRPGRRRRRRASIVFCTSVVEFPPASATLLVASKLPIPRF